MPRGAWLCSLNGKRAHSALDVLQVCVLGHETAVARMRVECEKECEQRSHRSYFFNFDPRKKFATCVLVLVADHCGKVEEDRQPNQRARTQAG